MDDWLEKFGDALDRHPEPPAPFAAGRAVGEEYAKRNRDVPALRRLAATVARDADRFYRAADPMKPRGPAYWVYVALTGYTPGEGEVLVEAEVVDFWTNLLDDPVGYLTADDPPFAAGFIAGALSVWDRVKQAFGLSR